MNESTCYSLPGSYGQRRLWFLHQAEPESAAYHIPCAARLFGRADLPAFGRALRSLCLRHEALRTSFREQDGDLCQILHLEPRVAFTAEDLSHEPLERARQIAMARGRDLATKPFDLRCAPLWRIGLWRVAEGESLLLLVVHHIISDGWSQSILIRELSAFYDAYTAGREPRAPDLEIDYGDYAAWERNQASTARWQSLLDRRTKLFAGQERAPELPRTASQGVRRTAGRLRFSIDAAVTERLSHLGKQNGASTFVCLLAAWSALLRRYSGHEAVYTGAIVANRQSAQLEPVVGLFANTVPLRIEAAASDTFPALLKKTQEAILDAMEEQAIPFELLLASIRRHEGAAFQPLFQTAVVFQSMPQAPVQLGDTRIELIEWESAAPKFDLLLVCTPVSGELDCTFEFASDIFDPPSIGALSSRFRRLLEAWTSDPMMRLEAVPLLKPDERDALLPSPAQVQGPLRRLHDRFTEQAARTPENIAVVLEDRRLSYLELDRASNRLAHVLRRRGVGPDLLTGIYLERSVETIIAVLAILKAGGAYLPLDARYPPDRVENLLDDAQPVTVITTRDLAKRLRTPRSLVFVDDPLHDEPSTPLDTATQSEHLAYVIYTSGSTGKPKGVLVTHANISRLMDATWSWFRFEASDVWTLFHSYAFDFSVWEIWGALLYGGALVIVPYAISRSPDEFLALLEREQVTVLNQTPSAFRNLCSIAKDSRRRLRLRYIIFGGEALDFAAVAPWIERYGEHRPALINMYGITETTVHVTWRPISRRDLATARGSLIGQTIPGLSLYVLDENMQPSPSGIAGELYVGGAGLARGYLNRPELTAERFVPDPWSGLPGARLYRTGDFAVRLSDGELAYAGRRDEQVKIRGFRIELGEIEAELREEAGVADAVVIAQKDPQGQTALSAYIVPDTQSGFPGIPALRARLANRLPDYMRPAAYVLLDRLPLTENGKLDKRTLPHAVRTDTAAEESTPRNRIESALAEAFCEVLSAGCIGIHDSFFDLGGDSMRALQLRSAAERRGLRFRVADLFAHPTVAGLAGVCGTARTPAFDVAPFSMIDETDRARLPDDAEDAYPLSHLQSGMLFHSAGAEEYPLYQNIFRLRLRGNLEIARLRGALPALAAAHPVLRTSFHIAGFSRPLQIVHRRAEIPLAVYDWRSLKQEAQDRAIAEWFAAERRRRLNWTAPPLLRFALHLLDGNTFELAWTEHHAILDGWSVAQMIADLFAAYRNPEHLTFAPQTARLFRQSIAEEQQALESEENVRFWSDQLAGAWAPELTEGEAARGAVAAIRMPIDPSLSKSLGALANNFGVPLKSVLLAVHLEAWRLACGRKAVITGYVLHTRPEIDGAERALGLFLNTVPLAAPHSSAIGLAATARHAWDTEQKMWPHRQFPYARIQALAGGATLCQTAFNFTHFHTYADPQLRRDFEVLEEHGSAKTNFAWLADFRQDSLDGSLAAVFSYDPARISESQARQIATIYETLIRGDPAEGFEAQFGVRPIGVEKGARPALLINRRDGELVTSVVALIAALFGEVLGTPRVGLYDSFFDLGGDSIAALRLIERVRQDFGIALPTSAIFEAPCPGMLADRLETLRGECTLLKNGDGRFPLFLAPAADGTLLPYRALIDRLPQGQTVYGFSTKLPRAGRTIESMASTFAAIMDSTPSTGPVWLGGWSMGGVVALEMARQRQMRGLETDLVVLIDSSPYAESSEDPDRLLWANFALGIGLSMKRLQDLASSNEASSESRRLFVLREAAQQEGLGAAQLSALELGSLFDEFRANWHAHRNYRPAGYDGCVLMIAGRGSKLAGVPNQTERVEIDATHFHILQPPAVDDVAALLGSRRMARVGTP